MKEKIKIEVNDESCLIEESKLSLNKKHSDNSEVSENHNKKSGDINGSIPLSLEVPDSIVNNKEIKNENHNFTNNCLDFNIGMSPFTNNNINNFSFYLKGKNLSNHKE